jgi:hypothetical protein
VRWYLKGITFVPSLMKIHSSIDVERVRVKEVRKGRNSVWMLWVQFCLPLHKRRLILCCFTLGR